MERCMQRKSFLIYDLKYIKSDIKPLEDSEFIIPTKENSQPASLLISNTIQKLVTDLTCSIEEKEIYKGR